LLHPLGGTFLGEPLPASISVVVIGAGPTGLTAANLLVRYGVDVLVLERNPQLLDIPRAIVLDDEGARVLQAAGIMADLLPRLVEGDGPIFYEEDGSILASLGPGTPEYGFRKRYFMHQPELEVVLQQRLREAARGRLCYSAEVTAVTDLSDHVVVEVRYDGHIHRIEALAVLACDGARSPTRESLGIKMEGDAYKDDWLVVDTLNDADRSRSSKAHCSTRRPYMSIPAPRGGRRYEFKLLPGEARASMMTTESVRHLLQPIRSLRTEDITRTAVYTFEARVAERLTHGRVLLLGDAAHLTPPFAGQGMNAGLKDAMNVAWKVALVVRGHGVGLLQTYDAERREGITAMIRLAVLMGEIIMPRDAQDRTIRAAVLARLAAFPGGHEYLIGMKFKPRPRYREGALVNLEQFEVPASLVGAMVPQPQMSVAGRQVMLDDLLGPRFALIAQSETTAAFASERRHQLWHELDPQLISITAQAPPWQDGVHATVLDQAIAAPLRAHRDQLLLVRPDRHAAVAFWPENAGEAVAAFRERLCAARTPLRHDFLTP
jgi:3-(3-hydroxy-phenyl)propionate hydroxylase